jgi:hypothetical protein
MAVSKAVSTRKVPLSAYVVKLSHSMQTTAHVIVSCVVMQSHFGEWYAVECFIHLNLARTSCNANNCSHICAVVEGVDECFCPVGFQLPLSSDNETCEGIVFYCHSLFML